MNGLINAKKELLEHIGNSKVEFVKITVKRWNKEPLQVEGTLEEVLPKLNFKYDDGYGSQELFGYIWYADGTWSDRGEYDGSEWWQHHSCPSRDIIVEI